MKGTPFAPDDRMRKVLEEAVVVGNATARTIAFAARPEEGFAYSPDSQWFNPLWVGGYEFLDPPPQITAEGTVPSPSGGARKVNSRIASLYPATGIMPAMCMRLPASARSTCWRRAAAMGSSWTGPGLQAHPPGGQPGEPLLVAHDL